MGAPVDDGAALPENDPTVFISHYRYTVNGIEHRIDPRDVVHFRHGIDPHNTRKGMSRLGSCLREILTDDQAGSLTASLMRNLGVPGVIIAPSNTARRTRRSTPRSSRQKFMEKFGGDKAGEPMVLNVAGGHQAPLLVAASS